MKCVACRKEIEISATPEDIIRGEMLCDHCGLPNPCPVTKDELILAMGEEIGEQNNKIESLTQCLDQLNSELETLSNSFNEIAGTFKNFNSKLLELLDNPAIRHFLNEKRESPDSVSYVRVKRANAFLDQISKPGSALVPPVGFDSFDDDIPF